MALVTEVGSGRARAKKWGPSEVGARTTSARQRVWRSSVGYLQMVSAIQDQR
jgi:hypothetical protein